MTGRTSYATTTHGNLWPTRARQVCGRGGAPVDRSIQRSQQLDHVDALDFERGQEWAMAKWHATAGNADSVRCHVRSPMPTRAAARAWEVRARAATLSTSPNAFTASPELIVICREDAIYGVYGLLGMSFLRMPRARSTNAVACHNLLSMLKFHCVYAKWLNVVKSGKLLILR